MKEGAVKQQTTLKNTGPWLSVIVPIFNSEKYLKRCIDSILCQRFQDFELLLIDDGSTDRTSEICRKYADVDKRVRYYRKDNGGCFQSRLYGVEKMRGQYFTFCDSDDNYRTPHAFQIIYDKIEQYKPQVLEFRCQTVFRFWRKPIKNNLPCDMTYNQKQFKEQLYPQFFFHKQPGSKLYYNVRSKVYEHCLAAKLPPADAGLQLFRGEDIVLNLYLLEDVESALLIPDILYSYRQPPNRGTRSFSEKEMEDLDKVTDAQLRFLERWTGTSRDQILLEEKIYKKIAVRLYGYAVNGARFLPEEELGIHLQEALKLPCFRLARQYYLENTENKWWLLDLLRNEDPKAYIERAKVENQENRLKKTIWRIGHRLLTGL